MVKSHFPGPSKVTYFEKRGAGVILNCQIIHNRQIATNNDVAVVIGDEEDIAKSFWEPDAEAKAVEYVESLGYVRAVDWQLPPSKS
jgi:hypothetical protein